MDTTYKHFVEGFCDDVASSQTEAKPMLEVIEVNKQVRISVVVPTRNRPELLNRCLSALVVQRIDPASFEIIIVDDGPSRDTQSLVEGWQKKILGHGPVI